MKKKRNIVCVGETLIDFIGMQQGVSLAQVKDYHRYIGGSPTNVAINLARLGLNVKMVATVGNDGFGSYAIERLEKLGVGTANIRKQKKISTSVIFISKSYDTPEFIPHRGADMFIKESQIRTSELEEADFFHTTCFALSKNPGRETIIKKAEEAYYLGCKLSIDVNFSNKIWDNKKEAISTLKKYCSFNPLVKASKDDIERLFGSSITYDEIFRFFHENNVDIVCLTLGKDGVILIAIIFVGLIVYNTNRSNKSFSSDNSNYEVKRTTMDSLQPKTSNIIVFYGRIKRQIINCEYKKENFRCDMVIKIDVDTQTVSCMEIGFMKKFKSIKRHFNAESKFIELSEIGTNATYYLTLHIKNNSLFSIELTNSDDNGFIYFDESILQQNT